VVPLINTVSGEAISVSEDSDPPPEVKCWVINQVPLVHCPDGIVKANDWLAEDPLVKEITEELGLLVISA
jgi:hypothetical protein